MEQNDDIMAKKAEIERVETEQVELRKTFK